MNFTLATTDMMGSVLQSMNPESGITQQQSYSAYGHTTRTKNNAALPGFNGERHDPLTDTSHLGNGYRAYNPTLMRFHFPDSMSPFGAGGINCYAYCSGDPINNSDPSGHMSAAAGVGIGLGGLGVLGSALSIMAFGVSIPAAMAAVASVTAIATGIASSATAESNPEASAALGWASLMSGIVGMAGGAATLGKQLQKAGIKISAAFSQGFNGGRRLPSNRAVVTQGTFGVFSTKNLDLSMPAIQSCIGVYGEDTTKQLLMCAHFDTEK